MQIKHLFVIALAAGLLVGCSQKPDPIGNASIPKTDEAQSQSADKQFAPPQVKRGINLCYHPKSGDSKPDEFMAKTDRSKVDVWFKINDDGTWYIDWDAERKPFDLIVIHHSAGNPKADNVAINELQRKRLYLSRYKSGNNDPYVSGLRPMSGHMVGGWQRFIGYHHLVYADGRVTTELQPLVKINDKWHVDMVGWHCGNWEANCRSVAICLVGNFSDRAPPDQQIEAARKLIAHYTRLVPKLTVQPHRDFKATECPGKTWDSWGERLVR